MILSKITFAKLCAESSRHNLCLIDNYTTVKYDKETNEIAFSVRDFGQIIHDYKTNALTYDIPECKSCPPDIEFDIDITKFAFDIFLCAIVENLTIVITEVLKTGVINVTS